MYMGATRKKAPTSPLTRERIVGVALAIVDLDGLDALSMRRLGAELDVDPMAVYYHIPNKEALLDAIVEAVMSGIDLSLDDPDAPPVERILCAAHAYLDVMRTHMNAMPLMLTRGPNTPAAARPVELLIGILRDAGLSPIDAMAGMNAIAAAVRGAAAMISAGGAEPPTQEEIETFASQFPAEEFPCLIESVQVPQDFMRDFDFGIRALAQGLLLSGGK